MPAVRLYRRALVALAVALLAVACTPPAAEPEAAPRAAEAEPTPERAAPESEPASEEASPSPQAPVSAEPSEAIASTAGDLPGLRLDVLELSRAGETVTLTFALVNEGEDVSFGAEEFLGPTDEQISFFSMAGVTLTDDVNSRRHLVLREPDGACVCSTNVNGLEAGERGFYSATFPAPPDDVEQMSVQVPHFPAVNGVPLTGG